MKIRKVCHLWLAGCLLLMSAATAASHGRDGQLPTLRLIELFTSQGCSSCPPADRLLGELLQQDDTLMALEFHVDYWDSLRHGSDGSWKDPFSQPQFTQRQRDYNTAGLAGRNGVYTPQAIVNGRVAAVGSDDRRLRQTLQQETPAALHIRIVPVDGDSQAGKPELAIRVDGERDSLSTLQGTQISLVRYLDRVQTEVTGGENNRRNLVNHHVVSSLVLLGYVDSQAAMEFSVAAPGKGEGCLVLVQGATLSPIVAAAECP